MTTHAEIAQILRTSITGRRISQAQLKDQAGISQRTLTKVLSGQEDFKLSTLMALADRLGLQLLLVPKDVAPAIGAGPVTRPIVRSRVTGALDRIETRNAEAGAGE